MNTKDGYILRQKQKSLGRGGIRAISDLTGVHRNTISAGLKELRLGEEFQDNEIGSGHVRRSGGGRKTVAQSQQGIIEALDCLIDNRSYGNPENPLRWTTKSSAKFG